MPERRKGFNSVVLGSPRDFCFVFCSRWLSFFSGRGWGCFGRGWLRGLVLDVRVGNAGLGLVLVVLENAEVW